MGMGEGGYLHLNKALQLGIHSPSQTPSPQRCSKLFRLGHHCSDLIQEESLGSSSFFFSPGSNHGHGMRGGEWGCFLCKIKKVGVAVNENIYSFSVSGGKIPFSPFRRDDP